MRRRSDSLGSREAEVAPFAVFANRLRAEGMVKKDAFVHLRLAIALGSDYFSPYGRDDLAAEAIRRVSSIKS